MSRLNNFLPLLRQIAGHPNNRKWPLGGIARFIGWQMWKWMVRRPIVVKVRANRRFLVAPDSPFSSQVVYNRLPEWDEMHFLLRYLRTEDRFLDLGANVGFHTVLASTIIERGEILSVEPSPRNLAILRQQVDLNRLTNVQIVESAIGAADGTVRFDAAEREMGTIVSGSGPSSGILEVSCQRLDTLLSTHLPPGVTIELAKMDVEGCEILVLQGARATLERGAVRTWLFEVSDSALRAHGGSALELLDAFTDSGHALFFWDEANHALHSVTGHARLAHANLIACLDPAHLHQRLGLAAR